MFRIILSVIAIMLASAPVVSAQETSAGSTTAEAPTEEALAWDVVKESDASADVFAFIERYPNGVFTKQAQALMIDLLWAEMAKASPETATGTEAVKEESVSEDVVAVTFSAPLTVGDPEIVGKSLKELIEGTPLFPPVEGLPDSYWKAQKCSNCHEWKQENLCTQANTYLSDSGGENLTKKHPYGGTFKQNLVNWATAGCE